MSPKTKKQLKEIKKNKKELILNTALEVFAQYGYHASSIAMITKKAGISKGLIYTYFKSKEELLTRIIFSGIQEFMEVFDPNKDGFLTEDEFDFFINSIFKKVKLNINFWKLYYSLLLQKEVLEIEKDKLNELFEPYFKTLIDYYERHGCKNPYAEAMLLSVTIDGAAMAYVNEPDMFPIDSVKELIIEKFKEANKK